MDMFEQTFVQTGKTSKTWTVLFSSIVQIVVIVVMFILPMIYFDALPKATLTSFLVAPPPPSPPPPPPAPEAPKVIKVIRRQFDGKNLLAPRDVPKHPVVIVESESALSSNVSSVLGGQGFTGVLGSLLGQIQPAAPPPAPAVKKDEKAAVPNQHIRVGGIVQTAKLVKQPRPNYPALAKSARIQGVVKLRALISKEGTIENLTVISGHPLLVPAALEAVKQWVYQPTLLNSEPVGVETEIDVNFTLSQY
jgi:periplasmic protein TonB